MWKKRIGYAYYIAALKGQVMTWKKACWIAERFSESELARIYMSLKARSV